MIRRTTLVLASLIVCAALRADVPLALARYGVAPSGGAPVIASNGSDFLIAWRSSTQINVLRPSIRRGGGLPAPAAVADDAFNFEPWGPSLAWSGSRFAVVYATETAIGLVMLDGDGNVTAPRRTFPINGYPLSQPQVAWDGQHFLIVYQTDSRDVIYGQLLDGDGVDAGSPFAIAKGNREMFVDFHVAGRSGGFMVVLNAYGSVRAIPINDRGEISKDTNVGSLVDATAIASDGRGFLVAMRMFDRVVTRVIAADGTPTSNAEMIARAADPAIAWNGADYLVTLTDRGEISLRRLTADGTPLDALPKHLTSGHGASMASAGAIDALAYADPSLINTAPYRPPDGVRAFTIASDNTLTSLPGLAADGIASIAAAEQDLVAAATNSFGTLIAWRETLGMSRTLRIGHLTPANEWRDADGTRIPGSPDFVEPAIATNGDLFLMVWIEHDAVRAIRVDRNGGVIDAQPLEVAKQIGPLYTRATVAWTGKAFAVIYPDQYKLFATRVSAVDGSIVDTRVIRESIDDVVLSPAAQFNGHTLVVAYDRWPACSLSMFQPCPVSSRAEVIALDADLEPRTARPTVLDDRTLGAQAPSIAWNSGGFVVVWPTYSSIAAAALDTDGGQVGSAHVIDGGHYGVSVGWDIDAFRVVALGIRELTELRLDAAAAQLGPSQHRFAIGGGNANALASAGSLAFFPVRLFDAPYYGASRIVVSTSHPRILPPPTNLQLTRRADGRLLIAWSYASNTAGAFRIETRQGSSAFQEISVAGGDARSAVVDAPIGAAVRIRAWSVDGMSGYSDEAVIAPRRHATK